MRISEFKDPFTGRKGIYLFTTDHLQRALLFRDGDDYVQGVNTIALATLQYPVKVLCYALMDNHIHLLVSGRYEDCRAFFAWVLHRLARMLEVKYGISGILRIQATDVQSVTSKERLLNEVCYLLRNVYKARIGSPYSNPWAPFECYFNPYLPLIHGTPMPGVKEAKQRFGTHVKIPSDWEHVNGRILSKCFVDYRTVEQKIGSSLDFFDRLRRYDLESIVEQEHGIEEKLMFTDAEMQEKIRAVCKNELHVASHHQLERKDLLWLACTLARRFACPKKQIARLLGSILPFWISSFEVRNQIVRKRLSTKQLQKEQFRTFQFYKRFGTFHFAIRSYSVSYGHHGSQPLHQTQDGEGTGRGRGRARR